MEFIANELISAKFQVKPIVSLTVPKGAERLRFCLHAYNSKEDITEVLKRLATFANV